MQAGILEAAQIPIGAASAQFTSLDRRKRNIRKHCAKLVQLSTSAYTKTLIIPTLWLIGLGSLFRYHHRNGRHFLPIARPRRKSNSEFNLPLFQPLLHIAYEMPLSLFALPQEILDMIYEYLLPEQNPSITFYGDYRPPEVSLDSIGSLLRVNREMYNGVSRIYCSQRTVEVWFGASADRPSTEVSWMDRGSRHGVVYKNILRRASGIAIYCYRMNRQLTKEVIKVLNVLSQVQISVSEPRCLQFVFIGCCTSCTGPFDDVSIHQVTAGMAKVKDQWNLEVGHLPKAKAERCVCWGEFYHAWDNFGLG